MKHNDQQVGAPDVIYIGTKASIEALPNPIAGWIAMASDTGLIGCYDGGKWSWTFQPSVHTHTSLDLSSGQSLSGLYLRSDGAGGTFWASIHDIVTLAASADALLGIAGQVLSLDTQAINKVFASPVSGSAAAPAFRLLDARDLPVAVSARAVRTTQQDIADITWTTLSFDSTLWDDTPIGTSHWAIGAPTRLVCRVAGTYYIQASAHFGANASGIRMIRLLKNGTEIFRSSANNLGASFLTTVTAQTLYKLAADEYIEAQVYQSSGGSCPVVIAYPPVPQLMFTKL